MLPERSRSTQSLLENCTGGGQAPGWRASPTSSGRTTGQDEAVRVFSKGCRANRKEFGLNELLYDVSVCRSGTVRSSVHGRQLPYIREVLWQVESEFALDGREALKDFNKLVCGSAQNKLFAGPLVAANEGFINVLLPAARVCTGRIVVVLLPHPGRWGDAAFEVRGWELKVDRWVPMQ